MRSDICEDGMFPDYDLADQSGRHRSCRNCKGQPDGAPSLAWRLRSEGASVRSAIGRCLSRVP